MALGLHKAPKGPDMALQGLNETLKELSKFVNGLIRPLKGLSWGPQSNFLPNLR